MWRKIAGGVLAAGLMAIAAGAETADGLVAKNIQARGGGKLRAVKTVRLSGTLTVEGAAPRQLVIEFEPRAHKVRMEVTAKGVADIRVYDGTAGWAMLGSEGAHQATKLSGEALKDMKSTADFHGGLFDYAEKGNKVEYLGHDELAGTAVDKLELSEANGDVSTIYLDAKTHLELEEQSTRSKDDRTTELTNTYSDYRQVEGLTLPFTIKARSKESQSHGMIRSEGSLVIALDRIEVNVDIPASRFARPEAATKSDP
jgi:hypothetical protein